MVLTKAPDVVFVTEEQLQTVLWPHLSSFLDIAVKEDNMEILVTEEGTFFNGFKMKPMNMITGGGVYKSDHFDVSYPGVTDLNEALLRHYKPTEAWLRRIAGKCPGKIVDDLIVSIVTAFNLERMPNSEIDARNLPPGEPLGLCGEICIPVRKRPKEDPTERLYADD